MAEDLESRMVQAQKDLHNLRRELYGARGMQYGDMQMPDMAGSRRAERYTELARTLPDHLRSCLAGVADDEFFHTSWFKS